MTRAVADKACQTLSRFSKRDRYSGSAKWRGYRHYAKGIAYAARRPAWPGRVLLLLWATVLANGFSLRAAVQPLQHVGHFRPDRILIQPKAGTSPAALANFHQHQGANVLRRFP